MDRLSVRECLRAGWTGFKSRPWLFVGTYVVMLIASFIANLPRSLAQHLPGASGFGLGFITFLISLGLSILISMGKTAFYLKAHDNPAAAEISDLWHPRPFWKFTVVTVLTGAATLIGLILLILPGIFIGLILGFSIYIVIEKQSHPFEAMKESIALTKGNRWRLFLLGLALLLLNLIGLCLLLVGLLVTLPISSLAIVHAYRFLSKAGTVSPVQQ